MILTSLPVLFPLEHVCARAGDFFISKDMKKERHKSNLGNNTFGSNKICEGPKWKNFVIDCMCFGHFVLIFFCFNKNARIAMTCYHSFCINYSYYMESSGSLWLLLGLLGYSQLICVSSTQLLVSSHSYIQGKV